MEPNVKAGSDNAFVALNKVMKSLTIFVAPTQMLPRDRPRPNISLIVSHFLLVGILCTKNVFEPGYNIYKVWIKQKSEFFWLILSADWRKLQFFFNFSLFVRENCALFHGPSFCLLFLVFFTSKTGHLVLLHKTAYKAFSKVKKSLIKFYIMPVYL